MPKRSAYKRIAITLPAKELAEADRLAAQLDRPRSWVIAEAVRRFSAASEDGIGPSRRAQLIADLALTPAERVRAAEETARVAIFRQPTPRQRIIGFDRYEDFLDWKRRRNTTA